MSKRRLDPFPALAEVISQMRLRPSNLFQDHMVIQRGRPVRVWGTAAPGDKVTARLGDRAAAGEADAEGNWALTLPPFPAGGPHRMVIEAGDESVEINDILSGDVWLASGQSNMGYTIEQGILNQEAVLASADLPEVRVLNVPVFASHRPEGSIGTCSWQACKPDSVPGFSAVATVFARDLHQATGIPIGIIHSSWGGSSIEAWLSREGLGNLPHLTGPVIPSIRDGSADLAGFNDENTRNTEDVLALTEHSRKAVSLGVLSEDFDESGWDRIPLPLWEKLPRGIAWLRRFFEITGAIEGKWELSLGYSQSWASIHLNGVEILNGQNLDCRVGFDADRLRHGRNLLVLRLANPWWPPFLFGAVEQACIRNTDTGEIVPLRTDWACSQQMEPTLPEIFSLQHIPTALYNAMIHPLRGLSLAGVIWYQGETNGDRGSEYRRLFPALIHDWRRVFDQPDLPFLWVQLANHGEPSLVANRGWPFLREAQEWALQLPRTGMAVAIDLGEALDIHPKNKEPVGQRLALQALRVVYAEEIEADGPCFRELTHVTDEIVLHFDHAEGLRVTDGKAPTGFAVAGDDRIFKPAAPRISGQTVILKCDGVDRPVAVRYAWSPNPRVNLVNGAGLPARPFRTDEWPEEVG